MNLINEGIQTTHTEYSKQFRQSQTTQTGFFQTEPDFSDSFSLIGTSRSDFSSAISRIDPSILANVSQSLRLPNPMSIVEFAESLNDSQFQFLLRLLSPIDTSQRIIDLPASLSNDHLVMFDLGFRFSCKDIQSSFLLGPFFVGPQPQHFSHIISAPSIPHQRIIFQSISASGPAFPPSLTMWSGESLIFSPNFSTHKRYIDLTSVINGRSNRLLEFTVQSEAQWYCLVIRAVTKIPYSVLISDALKRRLHPSQQSSICCPITGKVMKIPARSVKCQHTQCFELKKAIRQSEPGYPFMCPICNEVINFDDISVDWEMMKSLAGQRVIEVFHELEPHES